MAADNNEPQTAEEPEASPAFVEQYKLYVQSADNNSARRVSVNRYQTSLNMGVLILYGVTETIAAHPILQVLIAVAGIIIAVSWLGSIWSIRRLNVEKFKIIHSMEQSLPRAVYYEEWQGLGEAKGWRYRTADTFEKLVPWVFILLHVCALLYFGFAPMLDFLCSVRHQTFL